MTGLDPAELAQALFSEIGDALFLLDPETDQLIEVNPVALRLTGYARAELLGFSAAHLFRFEAPGGAQRLRGAFTKTMVFHGQDGFLLRTKGDAWVPVGLTVSRLHVAPKTLGLIIARDDRERRAALAQTRRMEAELRAVLGSSPAALWSAERAPGPDVFAGWQFRYVAPLLARTAGRPVEYFDGPFKWIEVVHAADREAYRTALRRLLTGGTEVEQLYRVQPADGGVRWVRDRLQVVRDASGRPVRLDGCVTDVTEQRRAEDALRQSEERFRALVEKSRDGILLVDERSDIRYATPALRSVLGYDPAAAVGRNWLALVHPDDRAAARERLADSLNRPGEDVPFTFRGAAADGALRVIEMNGVNRLDDPSVRAVVINYRDVTERDEAVRGRAREHALLEGLFASVPDIVVYKDRAGRLLGANPAFEALAGRPPAELVGTSCEELFTGEWAERVRAAEEGVLATGQTARCKEWVPYANGRKVLLDIALAPLRDDAGAPVGLIVVGRDVTEQDRLEDELRQSHKMEAVGRLAGGIAHDFNNLLTVVLGNLELVRSGAASGSEADDLLAGTERAARQAAELTKQMLGFARRQPLRTVTVDLNALVRDALSLLRRGIDPRVAVRFRPAADLCPVAADPVQVQQILMNLCLNARDAMPDGGTLTLETANDDGPPDAAPVRRVRLSVTDTGIGMTDEVRAKVFDPFFTTKGVGQGTGLGLAVVYGVAKAHGGWVDVTSAPGAGSRFDVYLPCAAATDERASAPGAPPDARKGSGQTVLVADDEAGVRDLARTALEMAGYRVLVAADGAEAVAVFRTAPARVALAVLDASMPRLSGRQVFAAIRKLDPAVKVLFASGYHDSGSGADAPGTHVLNKPYTPSELAAAVHDMLAAPR
ncbi:hybrid sensor histidine kinase/response regulator [Frigoriglobus tundricola]|uniref:histidine kinase n=1 Tax=Frigoriglobus tundricola TaxID=2774151 RepID=A0A6M5YNG1_9BACT|nr:PAS domain S-box protein [Frigoriglobus tundricola]QJW94876.1 Sensory box histidine kinase/response regulator [Frigoriglobus tundricola]